MDAKINYKLKGAKNLIRKSVENE